MNGTAPQSEKGEEVYTKTDYLYDRTIIENKLNRMYQSIDPKRWDILRTDFFVTSDAVVDLDMCSVFPGVPPLQIKGEDIAADWRTRVEKVDSAQHPVTCTTVDLPPAGSSRHPGTAQAISYGIVTLTKNVFLGEKFFRAGTAYFYDLVRSAPDSTGNPWRIKGLKCQHIWSEGNPLFLRPNEL